MASDGGDVRHQQAQICLHALNGGNPAGADQQGARQAEALGKWAAAKGMPVVYSSPLSRAIETAKIAFPKAAIIEMDGLMEQDAGELFRLFLSGARTENYNFIGHPEKISEQIGEAMLLLCSRTT